MSNRLKWVRWYRRAGPFLVAALLLASVPVALRPGAANASCNPVLADSARDTYYSSPGSYQVGVYKTAASLGASQVGGVYSRLWNYQPWVKYRPDWDQPNSTVPSWVMLRNNAYSSTHFAQVGWIRKPNGVRNTFIENAQAGFQTYKNYDLVSYSAEAYHSYRVAYNDPSPGKVRFYVDATRVWDWSYESGINPNEAKAASEIHTMQDQMPGSVASKMWFHRQRQSLG